jgi:hypothetical protein
MGRGYLLVEQLRKEWRTRAAAKVVDEAPRFCAGDLVLGAGTVLTQGSHEDGNARLSQNADGRLKTLLTVAYGAPVGQEAVNHLRTAVSRWRNGDRARASLHLALARVGRLAQPLEASRRLFMADGLMKAGVAPEAILDALDLRDEIGDRATKYSPDQPRVPAGNGRPSGEWTTTNAGGAPSRPERSVPQSQTAHGNPSRHGAVQPPHPISRPTLDASRPIASSNVRAPAVGGARTDGHSSRGLGGVAVGVAAAGRLESSLDLGALTETALDGLVTFVAGVAETGAVASGMAFAGGVTAFGILFIPDSEPRGAWVSVGGPGNISYYANPDETALRLKYTTADGVQRTLVASPGPDGNYRGPDGRVIARWVKGAARIGLVISTATLLSGDTGQLNLCPVAVPDKPHGNERAKDYEDYVKRIVNPDHPTPRGMGYALENSSKDLPTYFDDCHQRTGVLIEIKGLNYSKNLIKQNVPGNNMMRKILDQSENQVIASREGPIAWVFAEKGAADEVRKAFRETDKGREKIRVIWIPWVEGMK